MDGTEKFDALAERLDRRLPAGARVGVIGGRILDRFGLDLCRAVGHGLAALDDIVVVTGGVAGAGEAVSLAFAEACRQAGRTGRLFHLLPEGVQPAGSGKTLHAGATMAERRQVLGRLAGVYAAVGGGAGTADEIAVARSRGALVVPAAAAGGAAAAAWPALIRPRCVPPEQWRQLAATDLDPSRMGALVVKMLAAVLGALPGEGS